MFVVDPATGCWNWTGHKDFGYGRLAHRLAYRVVYELLRGEKPAHLQFDHLCRNRGCVNPDHLEPVTRAENVRRGAQAVLTRERVYEFLERRARGQSIYRIGKEMGVAETTLRHIANGLTWLDVVADWKVKREH